MDRVLKVRFLIVLTFLTGISTTPSFSQKKQKLKRAQEVLLNDSLATHSQSGIFDFPNLYKLKFYYNSKELEEIKSLDQPESQEAMYQSIKKYVRKFGIENFSKSTA